MTDEDLYREAALASLPQREKRFEADIRTLADGNGIDPETIMAFYPPERRKLIAEQGASWALSIFSDHADPEPDTSAVKRAESGAESLQSVLTAALPGSRFKAESQAQELTARVERIAARSLLPFRSTLLRIADDRIGNTRHLIGKLLRYLDLAAWILAGLAVLNGLLLCLVWRRDRFGIAYAGAGMAAGGLSGAAVCLPVFLLNIPGLVKEVSATCAEEMQWIIGRLTGRHLILCGALLLLGLLLFILGQLRKETEYREI